MLFKKLLAGFGLICLTSAAIAAQPPLRVLTTIKPLQLIATAVIGADSSVRVDVLLPPDVSPHDYQLKPSDRAKITDADVIFWVGPGLELFLERVLTSSNGHVTTEAFQPDGNHHSDAHIWMDPLEAAAIADRMALRLGELRPEHAAEWRRNAAELRQRLVALNAELSVELANIKAAPGYVVSHDAFGGFEARYGLKHVATLSDGEERPPGPRRIAAIQDGIARGDIGCALLEPQFDRKLVQTVLGGTAVRQIMVDALAGNIAMEPRGIENFYRSLGLAFNECLARK